MEAKIQSSLNEWREILNKEYGEKHIFNITLYGSQNYNLATPNSDVDVKAIYVPSVREAMLRRNRTSVELHNSKDEHCEVKDIREMCDMYLKQNLNFLETIYTPYRWNNINYGFFHQELRVMADAIVRYYPCYAVKSTCGQALNTIKQYRNNPTDRKKLSKIIFLYLYIEKYTDKKDYISCITVTNKELFENLPAQDLLLALKNNNFSKITQTLAYERFSDNIENGNLLNFFETYFCTLMNDIDKISNPDKDTSVVDLLQNFCYNVIMKHEEIK